jgi:L-lactate dehydrogenase complex protein LldG
MSRDAILAAARTYQGVPCPLPTVPEFGPASNDALLARFKEVLEQVGGRWVERTAGGDLVGIVRQHYPDATRIVSALEDLPISTVTIGADSTPDQLVRIELAILRGRVGVAENAAVWVDEAQLPHRALPFVAEHCVLLLDPGNLVADMHAAYAALAGGDYGWGAFVSGPSKTADIEQALVIGAQGPRSLLVVFDSSGTSLTGA